MMDIKDRITRTLEHWFLSEPALFQVLCTHEMVPNSAIHCPVRCGRGKVEYNPGDLENMTDQGLEEAFRTEAIRLLLRHPYERKPDRCSDQAVAVGSNITIGDNYEYSSLRIESPQDFELDKGHPYEWYARRIQEMLPPDGDGGHDDGSEKSDAQTRLENSAEADRDRSELWEEDDMMVNLINGVIDSVKDWGTLGGEFAEMLKASTKAKINWRNVVSGFRASILSSKRTPTRMRPNRRSGFEQLGSVRTYTTKLLVAVDVSGSITSENLAYFYGVINSAFRYGFTAVDVIQFDCGVRTVQSLTSVMRDVAVLGRGGTSFQEPIDYAVENGYDGLVILTDGYAPEPTVPDCCRTRILWVCEDDAAYKTHHEWMEKSGRVCTMQLN